MIQLAWRNLFQNRIRLAISIGGVALALLLILSLDAIFAGVEQRITVYIDHSGADIFVAQEDVRNLHMASSTLPDSVRAKVRSVPGVAEVLPIDYLSNMILTGQDRNLAYVIGLPKNSSFGGPWNIAAGKSTLDKGEAIIDRNIAQKSGLGLGDTVEILGEDLEIVGLSEETSSLVNSVAFISTKDFERLRGNYETFSFLLVRVAPGESPEAVADRIQSRVRDVTAQARPDFAEQERKVVNDMSTDVITMMNLIGFFIGFAVMALMIYTATLARRAEYGVLKALGAGNALLYRTVLLQAVISVLLGFGIALTMTLALSSVIPRLGLGMVMQLGSASLLKVGSLSLVIAGTAAILPIRQIAGLDPALVFRGR